MDNRGANAIQPSPLVCLPGSSEGRPGQLLAIETVGTQLRVVLYDNGPVKIHTTVLVRSTCSTVHTCPFGRAPGSASVEISLPKPGWYCGQQEKRENECRRDD